MKRYISATTFPKVGSGRNVNRRGGVIPFGGGDKYEFRPGWTIMFSGSKPTFDVNSGTVSSYFNVFIDKPSVRYPDKCSTEFFGYTTDELERLWDTVTSVSDEELETMIRDAARR